MIFVLGAALLVVLTWTVLAQVQSPDTAKDPVCGMTVTKSTAKYTYDYKGTTYYFCSEGCKTSFSKEPEKYLAQTAETKPGMMGQGMGKGMGQGMGMMHGQQDSQLSKDIALDPVCGMVVKKSTAKYSYDYKGTTITSAAKAARRPSPRNPRNTCPRRPTKNPERWATTWA
jgi:Cu+-exporting ATPase